MPGAAVTFHVVNRKKDDLYQSGTNVLNSRFEDVPTSYPNPASSDHSSLHLLGACTGLIAASAVASADSLITLLPLAVDAVRIAFRIGAFVSDVAGRLVGLPKTSDSWSTVVAVTDKEAAEIAVGKWNQTHVNPTYSIWHVLSLMPLGGRSLQPSLDQCIYAQYNHHQWPIVPEKTLVGRVRYVFTSSTTECQSSWTLSRGPFI